MKEFGLAVIWRTLFLILLGIGPQLTLASDKGDMAKKDKSSAGCARKLTTYLLPEAKLRGIARAIDNYRFQSGAVHRWRDSGSGDPFMHARENPMAHWLSLRFLGEELRAAASGQTRDELLRAGNPLPFFEREFWDIAIGDGHYGNIGILPLIGPSAFTFGKSPARARSLYEVHLHLVFNDVDDAGYGPLFGDMLRNAATSALVGHDVSAIAQAYRQGLSGSDLNPPAWVRTILKMSVRDFSEMQHQKTQKLFRDGRFVKGGGEISYDVPGPIVDHLMRLFPSTVRDASGRPMIASFTKRSGGSGGISRYWVLRELYEAVFVVTEVKWITDRPGVMGFWEEQEAPGERFEIATAQMWHGLHNHEIRRIDLRGRPYFTRPKYENPIKKQVERFEEERRQKQLVEWAVFSASLLGHNHRGNPNHADDRLATEIQRYPEAYLQATDSMVRMINFIFEVAREEGLGLAPAPSKESEASR